MLMAILQHLDNADDPYRVVATLLGNRRRKAATWPCHTRPRTSTPQSMAKMAESLNQMMAEKVTFRAPFRGSQVLRRP